MEAGCSSSCLPLKAGASRYKDRISIMCVCVEARCSSCSLPLNASLFRDAPALIAGTLIFGFASGCPTRFTMVAHSHISPAAGAFRVADSTVPEWPSQRARTHGRHTHSTPLHLKHASKPSPQTLPNAHIQSLPLFLRSTQRDSGLSSAGTGPCCLPFASQYSPLLPAHLNDKPPERRSRRAGRARRLLRLASGGGRPGR